MSFPLNTELTPLPGTEILRQRWDITLSDTTGAITKEVSFPVPIGAKRWILYSAAVQMTTLITAGASAAGIGANFWVQDPPKIFTGDMNVGANPNSVGYDTRYLSLFSHPPGIELSEGGEIVMGALQFVWLAAPVTVASNVSITVIARPEY